MKSLRLLVGLAAVNVALFAQTDRGTITGTYRIRRTQLSPMLKWKRRT